MGTVCRAWDRKARIEVAVKFLGRQDPADARRFEREASVLAELSHPGIVKYVAHGVDAAGIPYLAMEWLNGETLAHRMATTGLSLAETVDIVRQVAAALVPAHACHLVHRDIKPTNIFLVDGQIDQVKLIDFGLARRSWRAPTPQSKGHTLTHTGVMLGTPGYMAPEQARGTRDIDARADVFALGCILYECLTGQPAFAGEKETTVLAKILLREVPSIRAVCPEAPVALDALVHRMLAKTPGSRPAEAGAIERELSRMEPLPATSRQRFGQPEPPTEQMAAQPAEWVQVVFVGTRAQREASEHEPTEAEDVDAVRAREAAEAHHAQVEALADGSVVAVLSETGSPAEQAVRAAECALSVRRALPRAPVAIAGGASPDPSNVLERAARTLEMAALAAIFAPAALGSAQAGAIWLDDTTAKLLEGRYTVHRHPMGQFLFAEDPR